MHSPSYDERDPKTWVPKKSKQLHHPSEPVRLRKDSSMDWDHPDRRFQSPSEEVYENYDGQRSTRDMYSPGSNSSRSSRSSMSSNGSRSSRSLSGSSRSSNSPWGSRSPSSPMNSRSTKAPRSFGSSSNPWGMRNHSNSKNSSILKNPSNSNCSFRKSRNSSDLRNSRSSMNSKTSSVAAGSRFQNDSRNSTFSSGSRDSRFSGSVRDSRFSSDMRNSRISGSYENSRGSSYGDSETPNNLLRSMSPRHERTQSMTQSVGVGASYRDISRDNRMESRLEKHRQFRQSGSYAHVNIDEDEQSYSQPYKEGSEMGQGEYVTPMNPIQRIEEETEYEYGDSEGGSSRRQQSIYANQSQFSSEGSVGVNVQSRGAWNKTEEGKCRCSPTGENSESEKQHETNAFGDSEDVSTTAGSYSQSFAGNESNRCDCISTCSPCREPWRPSCPSRCVMPPSCINNSPRLFSPLSSYLHPCHPSYPLSPRSCFDPPSCISDCGPPYCSPSRFGPPYCPSPLPLSPRCYNRCIASPRCCEYPPCRNPLLVDGCCNTSTDLSSRWVSPSGCRNSPQRNKSCCCICPCGNFDIEPEPQETQENVETEDFEQNYPIPEQTQPQQSYCGDESCKAAPKKQSSGEEGWKSISQSCCQKMPDAYSFRQDNNPCYTVPQRSVLQQSNCQCPGNQCNHQGLNNSSNPQYPEMYPEDNTAMPVAEITDDQNRICLEVRICPCDTPATCNPSGGNSDNSQPISIQQQQQQKPMQNLSKIERFTWDGPPYAPNSGEVGSSQIPQQPPMNNTCSCRGPTQWMSPKASCAGVGCRQPPFYGYKRTKSPKYTGGKMTLA